jgi:hypothetical protein
VAERGNHGPFFYRGYYGHKSVRSDELTFDQRMEYRGIYRMLYRRARGNFQSRMKARAAVRSMLYSTLRDNN